MEASTVEEENAMKKYTKPEIVVENLEEDLAILTSGEPAVCSEDLKLA